MTSKTKPSKTAIIISILLILMELVLAWGNYVDTHLSTAPCWMIPDVYGSINNSDVWNYMVRCKL